MVSLLELALVVLVLLEVKHLLIDYVNQSELEIATKGKYMAVPGVYHSIKHGLATSAILVAVHFVYPGLTLGFAVLLGVLDFIVHYHIDWLKTNFGNRNMQSKAFWVDHGLDQLAHHLTYIGVVAIVTA